MKYSLLLAALLSIFFTGCGKIDRMGTALTGHSETCVDGVVYLQFTSGATVKYLPNGKVATCQ